jgi:hypothetical protein
MISTSPVALSAAPKPGETCQVFKGNGDSAEIPYTPALSPAKAPPGFILTYPGVMHGTDWGTA